MLSHNDVTITSGIINISLWIILYAVFARIPVEFLTVSNRILQVFIEISKYLTPSSLAGIGVSLTSRPPSPTPPDIRIKLCTFWQGATWNPFDT